MNNAKHHWTLQFNPCCEKNDFAGGEHTGEITTRSTAKKTLGIARYLSMTIEIFIATTDTEIESCFPAFGALRPHIEQKSFLAQILRQQAQSYQILALRHEGVVKSAAGFRLAEFLAWGKVLYIDDLTTLPGEIAKGFAGSLLDWLINHARSNQCQGVHLDTGYTRHAAHRLYLRKGLQLCCHHLALEFKRDAQPIIPPDAAR